MSRLIPEEERNKAYLDHHRLISNLRTEYFLQKRSSPEFKPGLPVNEDSVGYLIKENILAVKLKNNGDLPSTNVHVKLLLKMYGSKNIYPKEGVDKSTLIDREFFEQEEVNIRIPYIGADEEISYKILVQKGQFRETELFLISIKANGFTYVKNSLFKNFFFPDSKILLNHYEHPLVNFIKLNLLKNQNRVTEEDIKMFYGFSEKKKNE